LGEGKSSEAPNRLLILPNVQGRGQSVRPQRRLGTGDEEKNIENNNHRGGRKKKRRKCRARAQRVKSVGATPAILTCTAKMADRLVKRLRAGKKKMEGNNAFNKETRGRRSHPKKPS